MKDTQELAPEELDEIRARCDRATPGPWRSYVEGRDHTGGSTFIMVGEGATRRDDLEINGASPDDNDFIAHARQDIPRLVEEVLRLRRLVEGQR